MFHNRKSSLVKMSGSDRLLLVYSTNSNVFYERLAQRLLAACKESSLPVESRTATQLRSMTEDQLADTTLILVNPVDCAHKVGNAPRLFSRVSAAKRRLMILAEAVETTWFKNQFQLPIQYDALIDVGFASQHDKLEDFDIPYRFLFNGATRQEAQTIAQPTPSRRHIPWTIVGHRTAGRVKLASELIRRVDPGGLVFLPDAGTGVRRGGSSISPLGLASVLSRTRYYVWTSHHEFAYYESFRFIEAILAGAMPCKVDSTVTWEQHGIPGIFESIETLCDFIRSKRFSAVQRSAREYYLSQGRLADHLQAVLENV
jgi:hypothetical protein